MVYICVLLQFFLVAASSSFSLDSLLANMTIPEKARQLTIFSGDAFLTNGDFDEVKALSYLGTLGAGVLDNLGRQVDPLISNAVQKAVAASSRLGIGAILAEECQHGVQGDHHSMFPSPITLAATFDTELLGEVGRVLGAEARASGINQCWSPVCGLAREPRWGRMEEEFGEDTFLAGEMAGAMSRGMVGPDGPSGLSSPDSVSPLIKHYAGYSVPQGGHNIAPSQLGGVRGLLSEYLPVFQKAIAGGAQGVMSSYNEVDGVPTSGDPWLLTDVLRGQLGFDGYVSSDFGAISGLGPRNHAIAANDSDCVRVFLEAGGSVNGHDFNENWESLVINLATSGTLPLSVLDRAVGDVLRVKGRLGLLEGGGGLIVDPSRVSTLLGDNVTHVATALRAARESVVLLENTHSTLPLNPSALKKVLVVGPNADAIRAGDYSAGGWAGGSPNGGGNINNANSVTVVQALKALLPNALVQWAPAASLLCEHLTDPAAPNPPLWSTVQMHSLSLTTAFTPSAPSIPFTEHPPPPRTFLPGSPGLAATYFSGGAAGTQVLLTRVDAAPNFHFFALGPDMWRFRNNTFRVRWEGTITPDSTVKGGGLRANPCQGSSCPGDGRVQGARVYLDGVLVIDGWGPGGRFDCSVDWERGVGRAIVIEYWQGVGVSEMKDGAFFLQWSMLSTQSTAQQTIEEAVKLAGEADVVVAVVGGANNDGDCTTEGEGRDRASLNLGGTQGLLLEALSPLASSLVTVLMDSKPLADPALGGLPTVLASFQGGQAGGQAIGEVILGVTEPSGRLPITFPASAEVLPVYYSRKPSGMGLGSYCDFPGGGGDVVHWPFGYGLSYTSFSLSNLSVPVSSVPTNGTAVVSVTVKNTGTRQGWAVPQLYLRRQIAEVTTPALSLKGFARLLLAPGESVQATFSVDIAKELQVWGRDLLPRIPGGNISCWVGTSSADLPLKGWFVVG